MEAFSVQVYQSIFHGIDGVDSTFSASSRFDKTSLSLSRWHLSNMRCVPCYIATHGGLFAYAFPEANPRRVLKFEGTIGSWNGSLREQPIPGQSGMHYHSAFLHLLCFKLHSTGGTARRTTVLAEDTEVHQRQAGRRHPRCTNFKQLHLEDTREARRSGYMSYLSNVTIFISACGSRDCSKARKIRSRALLGVIHRSVPFSSALFANQLRDQPGVLNTMHWKARILGLKTKLSRGWHRTAVRGGLCPNVCFRVPAPRYLHNRAAPSTAIAEVNPRTPVTTGSE
ncbi:hypothetical protein HPB50_028108 [Hyalomma asiaticum]|nr:hypothetical protein HPB50_028108 [Hyalomma asiaticum]